MLTIREYVLDNILVALANPVRRAVIHELAFSPATVSNLAKTQGYSLPAIDRHIDVLDNAHLIIRRKIGRTNFLALNPAALSVLQQWLAQYHTSWGNAEATLENYIAKMQE